MSLPSRFRNAAAKAGSRLLRFLDTLPPLLPRVPGPEDRVTMMPLPEWAKPPSPERMAMALKQAQDGQQAGAQTSARPYSPEELLCDPYPAAQLNSTAPSSSARVDLATIRRANITRQAEWCPDQLPDLSFRGNELAGETGEACNVIKKLERERLGWRGSRSSKEKLAEELADVVNCADLCALAAGIDLADAFVTKWNATSTANGLKTFIGPSLDELPERWEDDNREVTNHYARRDAAERTLARLGYSWSGGKEWKPPLGKPPAYITDDPGNVAKAGTGETLERIASRLKVPVSTFTDPKPKAERDEDVRVFPRSGGAARILESLGWRWIAGRWIQLPPVGLEPGTAENLRDAIAFALDGHNPDGLEWLRSWEEGDPSAMEELEQWRHTRQPKHSPEPIQEAPTPEQVRLREEARAQRPATPCPRCGAPEGEEHRGACTLAKAWGMGP